MNRRKGRAKGEKVKEEQSWVSDIFDLAVYWEKLNIDLQLELTTRGAKRELAGSVTIFLTTWVFVRMPTGIQ